MPTAVNARPLIRNLAVPYVLSAVLVVMLLISSIVGLVFGQSHLYDPTKVMAFVGQDAVTLVVALPILIVAIWLARRGSTRGLLVWMGMLFYLGYGYAYYVFGMRFNYLYILYLAIVVACAYALLWMLLTADSGAFRSTFDIDTPVRRVGGLLIAVALLFFFVWLGAIGSATASGITLNPVLRLVSTLDLTVSLPVSFIGGLLLWRRQPWGYVIGILGLINLVLYMFTLLVANVLMAATGSAMESLVIVYIVLCLASLVGTVFFLRSVDKQIW